MKTKTGKSPMDCKTIKEVCNQKTDNFQTKDFWILSDSKTVTIAKQRKGEPLTEWCRISKKQFDQLIKWYLKKQ